MKPYVLLFALVAAGACNQQPKTSEPVAETVKPTPVTYPYTIDYSANFTIGDPKHSQMILGMWKDFDNNTLDNSRQHFADTVTMEFPDERVSGPIDSLINSTKTYRNMFARVNNRVQAVMSVKATDTNDDWVLVWGTEVTTDKNDKTDSSHLHEAWRLNKNGKVIYMAQFRRKALPAI